MVVIVYTYVDGHACACIACVGPEDTSVLLLSCYSCSFVAGSLTDLTSKLWDLPVNTSPVLELQACDAILGLFFFEAGSGIEPVLVFSKQVLY